MTYPPYIRDKARQMRVEQKLSLDEIAERLSLPKATVWYWIKDLPLGRDRRTDGQRKAADAVRTKYKELRDVWYGAGLESWPTLSADPRFRDFVALYLAEGSKRNRNRVAIGNSDPAIVALADHWIRTLSKREPIYSVQFHADQDLDELRGFWGSLLNVPADQIRTQRKSNSGQMRGRTWRSRYGVLTVTVNDTCLRARLEAWIVCLRATWRLDFAA